MKGYWLEYQLSIGLIQHMKCDKFLWSIYLSQQSFSPLVTTMMTKLPHIKCDMFVIHLSTKCPQPVFWTFLSYDIDKQIIRHKMYMFVIHLSTNPSTNLSKTFSYHSHGSHGPWKCLNVYFISKTLKVFWFLKWSNKHVFCVITAFSSS